MQVSGTHEQMLSEWSCRVEVLVGGSQGQAHCASRRFLSQECTKGLLKGPRGLISLGATIQTHGPS